MKNGKVVKVVFFCFFVFLRDKERFLFSFSSFASSPTTTTTTTTIPLLASSSIEFI